MIKKPLKGLRLTTFSYTRFCVDHAKLKIYPLIRKTVQSPPSPFKKRNHSRLLISATVDAFRGHGFSLLVTAFLRGLQLMHLPLRFRCRKTSAIPAEVATCASIN